MKTDFRYGVYYNKIVENVSRGDILPVAVDRAVRECIEQDVLREFLIKHQAEVIGMILEEFNMKEFLEMDRRDEFAAGKDAGKEEGKEEEHAKMVIAMVNSAMENFQIDLETACKGLGITVEEYRSAKER
ncbi:MAG: hypothetical protein J6A08_12185 [Lachnospiraceae bacterium]|nr:hypothetical protein [Lachnospiraceae bacterium]